MPLEDHVLAVRLMRAAVRDQAHRLGAEAHGTAHVAHVLLLRQQVYDWVRRILVELPGVGALQAADVARVLDDGALHAQADTQVRHLVLAAVLNGVDLALYATHAETAGHDHAVGASQTFGDGVFGQLLGVYPEDLELAPVVDGRVLERLPD